MPPAPAAKHDGQAQRLISDSLQKQRAFKATLNYLHLVLLSIAWLFSAIDHLWPSSLLPRKDCSRKASTGDSKPVFMYSSRNMQERLSSLVNKFFEKDFKGSLAVTGRARTRRGYVAMYVGEEGERFEVPVKYLSNPVFQELLRRSQNQDLDCKIEGAIRIPHSTAFFYQFLRIVKEYF
ncbi:hypothetical protein SADUNF_Sadunf13G0046100 [Salix dunnii]|uniref:SAUR-like auxin-responsive protein family n=1 Tax=Salix dunnii TaxID=1413687 RepID=A0A835JKQ4_9ROSI|nr:hypothetical protein SADUNF_Sadunf13G0046100 [Salix dunnii]